LFVGVDWEDQGEHDAEDERAPEVPWLKKVHLRSSRAFSSFIWGFKTYFNL
jgi:hypothetical protein